MRPGRRGDTWTRAGASRLVSPDRAADSAMCHPAGASTRGRSDGGRAWNQAAKRGSPLVSIAGAREVTAAVRGARAPSSHHASTYVAAKNAMR